jgi:outer membrane protein W
MSHQLKRWLSIGLWCMSTTVTAGTIGDVTNYSGLWAGVGGGYVSTSTNGGTDITVISNTPSPAMYLNTNVTNRLAPVVNAGFLFQLPNQWLLGPKAIYKYIGIEQFAQSWSGTSQDGTYQTAGLHTKMNHEFFLLLDAGFNFDHWLVYAGAGPAINSVSAILNGDVLPATSFAFSPVNISKNKIIWGGAGQVGFEYMLPYRFMVDISYNFMATGKTHIANITLPTTSGISYTVFSQSLQVIEQGVNITVNKYFI